MHISCRTHRYIYYPEFWMDQTTGKQYNRGYYDENGRYYDASEIAFRNPDGSYKAHFTCQYCGAEAEYMWREGQYPNCNNCGAMMTKTPTYIDDVLEITRATIQPKQTFFSNMPSGLRAIFPFLMIWGIQFFLGIFISMIMFMVRMAGLIGSIFNGGINSDSYNSNYYDNYDSYSYTSNNNYNDGGSSDVSNTDIFGTKIYLDEVDTNKYVICESTDDYEKVLKWDYGVDCYYDSESDVYLWYNTDVAPNLWQYWYEDIAGSDDYGWMECEDGDWYIEIDDGDWVEYSGNTGALWYIVEE